MFSFLRGLLGRQKRNPADGSSAPLYFVENIYLPDFEADPGTRYPPFPEGCEIVEPRRLLAGHRTQIARLKQSLGLSEQEFRTVIDPVLVRYAEFVHLLPASQDHHHKGRGGLLRHGLEVAFHAARMSGAVIYDADATPRERRNREKVWRVATALAGLLHDVGKPVCDMKITSDTGLLWNFALQEYGYRLVPWARDNKVQRYFVSWREDRLHNRHAFHGPGIARLLIPKQTRTFLTPDNTMEMLDQIDEAIGGYAVQSKIAHVVLKADQASVTLDLKLNGGGDGSQAFMPSVERYLVEGTRRMIKSGRWKINEPGGIVYVFREGLFINWKAASRDVVDRLNEDGIQAIPKDIAIQADMLIQCGVAASREIEPTRPGEPVITYRYWAIKPLFGNGEGPVLALLKIQETGLFFPMGLPAPIEGVLTDAPEKEQVITQAAVATERNDAAESVSLETAGVSDKGAARRKKKAKAGEEVAATGPSDAETSSAQEDVSAVSSKATSEFDALLEHVTGGPQPKVESLEAETISGSGANPEPAPVSESSIGMDLGADFFETLAGPPLDAYEQELEAIEAQERDVEQMHGFQLLEPDTGRKPKRGSHKTSSKAKTKAPSAETTVSPAEIATGLPGLLSFAEDELKPVTPVVHQDDACFEVMDLPFGAPADSPRLPVAVSPTERVMAERGVENAGQRVLITPPQRKPRHRRSKAEEIRHSDSKLPGAVEGFKPLNMKVPDLRLDRFVDIETVNASLTESSRPMPIVLEQPRPVPIKYLHTVEAPANSPDSQPFQIESHPMPEWDEAEGEQESIVDEQEHIELDVQFSDSASPEQCLEELFEMIMRGYGRWLPDTLRKTKKGIAAGIACLDMVSADYPNIRRKDLEKALRYIIRKKTARYDLEVDRYFIYVRPKAPEREGSHE
ncbi:MULTISPECIES: MobH family relaxase [Pseudomonas]|nr:MULTISPECIES: MobH family relaxase [Pseudomonas]